MITIADNEAAVVSWRRGDITEAEQADVEKLIRQNIDVSDSERMAGFSVNEEACAGALN